MTWDRLCSAQPTIKVLASLGQRSKKDSQWEGVFERPNVTGKEDCLKSNGEILSPAAISN